MKLVKLTYKDELRNLLTVIIDNPVAKYLLKIEDKHTSYHLTKLDLSKIPIKLLLKC